MTVRLVIGVLTAALIAAGASVTGQTLKTSRVMKEKLTHAQRILEALTTSNYPLLDQQAEALSRIVDSPEWDELKTPEFRGYIEAFTKATRDLLAASKRRDLDTAAARYEPLVASCYSCHRYRKGSRLAPVKPSIAKLSRGR